MGEVEVRGFKERGRRKKGKREKNYTQYGLGDWG
jgi:hypothetical protein